MTDLRSWRGWGWATVLVLCLLGAVYAEGLLGWKSIGGAGLLPYEDTLYGPLHNCPSRLVFRDPTPAVYNQPWDTFAWQQLRMGKLPLWQPHNGFGVPLLASGQSAPFNPLKVLFCWGAVGPPEAWFLVLRLACGALGMLLLAKKLGWRPLTGALVAIGFVFSGGMTYHFQNVETSTLVGLPWLLLAGEAVLAAPGAVSATGFGLVIGLVGLLGHPEPALLCAAGSVLAVLFGLVGNPDAQRVTIACLSACVLGIGLDAFTLLPFAELVRHSESYLFDATSRMASSAYLTWKVKLSLLGVHLLSADGRPEVVNFNDYAGAAPLILAPFGLRDARARRIALALSAVAGLCLLTCPPGQHLTLWPIAPNSNYVAMLLVTAILLLGGGGFELICASGRDRQAAALFAVALTVAAVALQVQAQRELLGDFRSFILSAAVCAGAIAALRWQPRALALTIVLVTALALAWDARAATPYLPKFAYGDTPITRYLRSHAGNARVTGGLRCLLPDSNLMHGLDSIDTYEVFHPRRYTAFLSALLGHHPSQMGWLGVDGPFQPALLDLAGVRYLALASPDDNQDHAIDRYRAEIKELKGYPVIMRQGRATLYENVEALPRAYVMFDADYAAGFDGALKRLESAPERYRTRALIECPPSALPRDRGDAAGTPLAVPLTQESAQAIALQATLPRPGWLVLADLYYPGWQAEVDGRPTPIRAADVAFRGVYLSAGPHRVRFFYRPTSFASGMLISLATLAVALLLLAWRLAGATLRLAAETGG